MNNPTSVALRDEIAAARPDPSADAALRFSILPVDADAELLDQAERAVWAGTTVVMAEFNQVQQAAADIAGELRSFLINWPEATPVPNGASAWGPVPPVEAARCVVVALKCRADFIGIVTDRPSK